YRDTATRYESDPTSGEGKKELMAKAKQWEKKRDHAEAQIPNFEYAEALFQIAIVLGSVAIVAASVWLVGLSGLLALGGILLTINRSEEHTSELQSQSNIVCRLLLEKKKNTNFVTRQKIEIIFG